MTNVRIRNLRPGEEQIIRQLWEHLSPRSRYHRFLSVTPGLPDSLVRSLASVDNERQLALVAEREGGPVAEVVGLASFAATDDESGEVGIVVRDDWHKRQVGTELATRLLHAAERRGFRRFVAHVVVDNAAVRPLLAKVAVVVSSRVSRGMCEIAFVRRAG
jgi:RimJ/RimL family protein N-acetyltransferase